MAMVTELALLDKVVIGGEKIAVHKWTTNNYHVQQLCEVLSRLTLAMLEMDSNNSTGAMILTDSEDINSEWARFRAEWDLAKESRHLAPAAQEKTLAVLYITDNESLRTVNVRLRRLVHAIATLSYKMLFSDSAKLQYGLTDRDISKFEAQMSYVEKVLKMYVGSGKVEDMGREVPAFEHLGTVVPPLNLHQAIVSEPSPASADTPGGDVADTASTVPAPGSSTGKA